MPNNLESMIEIWEKLRDLPYDEFHLREDLNQAVIIDLEQEIRSFNSWSLRNLLGFFKGTKKPGTEDYDDQPGYKGYIGADRKGSKLIQNHYGLGILRRYFDYSEALFYLEDKIPKKIVESRPFFKSEKKDGWDRKIETQIYIFGLANEVAESEITSFDEKIRRAKLAVYGYPWANNFDPVKAYITLMTLGEDGLRYVYEDLDKIFVKGKGMISEPFFRLENQLYYAVIALAAAESLGGEQKMSKGYFSDHIKTIRTRCESSDHEKDIFDKVISPLLGRENIYEDFYM